MELRYLGQPCVGYWNWFRGWDFNVHYVDWLFTRRRTATSTYRGCPQHIGLTALNMSAKLQDLFGREEWRSGDGQVLPQQFRFIGTTLTFEFARFIHDAAQVVLTRARSSEIRQRNMMRAGGHGIISPERGRGDPLCHICIGIVILMSCCSFVQVDWHLCRFQFRFIDDLAMCPNIRRFRHSIVRGELQLTDICLICTQQVQLTDFTDWILLTGAIDW